MKNIETLELAQTLNQTSFSDIKDFKFNFAVIKNKDRLAKCNQSVQKMIEEMLPEEYSSLKDELLPLVQKDPENEMEIIKKWEKFTEWESACKERDKIINSVYEEESDFEPYFIEMALLEKLQLNDSQTQAIYHFIKE